MFCGNKFAELCHCETNRNRVQLSEMNEWTPIWLSLHFHYWICREVRARAIYINSEINSRYEHPPGQLAEHRKRQTDNEFVYKPFYRNSLISSEYRRDFEKHKQKRNESPSNGHRNYRRMCDCDSCRWTVCACVVRINGEWKSEGNSTRILIAMISLKKKNHVSPSMTFVLFLSIFMDVAYASWW